MTSCLGTRHLQDDQLLLRKQTIKGNDEISTEELEELYKQHPNKKIPFIPFAPYVWIYYVGFNNYHPSKIEYKIKKIEEKYEAKIAEAGDRTKKVERLKEKKEKKITKKQLALEKGNLFMRWGEPLAVYDPAKTIQTNDQMDLYLKTKGYFHSSVNYIINKKGRKVRVEYKIQEETPHIIDTFRLTTDDKNIEQILLANQRRNFIKKGSNYDQTLLSAERRRVEELLQNNGYYDFRKQHIGYKIDTLSKPYRASVEMIIANPKRGYHKVFTIDSVIFVTDAGIREGGERQSEIYNKIKYRFYEKKYSKKILDQRMFIYPGEIYSKKKSVTSQLQLANLDNFKFINLNYDTTGGHFIANVYTTNLPRYQLSNEVGVSVTEGFPGPFYRFSLKNRNVFKGLENAEISGYFGLEGVASLTGEAGDIYSSTEVGTKLSLYFPQFIFPGFSKFKRASGKYNPQTVLRTGFDYTKRPEYNRKSFNTSWIYNWRNFEKRINYNFTLNEVSFINSWLSEDFNTYLNYLDSLGNNLRTSFEPSVVSSTSMLVTFNFDPIGDLNKKASYLRTFAELGGFNYNFYDPKFLEDRDLEYYQFLKGSVEYIRHVPVRGNGIFASRIKVGASYPYGDNNALPYEKYFFSGGSSSVRAWRPRRLGPGSYNHNAAPGATDSDGTYAYNNKVEQPGELLLEGNIEYRSKLVGFLDWAYFVDFGNIWLFDEDLSRPGGKFELNRFYKEFGVGTGVGLRLNFSFLIVRFDYAVKIYDPMRPEGERYIGNEYKLSKLQGLDGQALWNFAIGYPF